jgi:hypothetical protein
LEYRFYFLDGLGHIKEVREFEANDDNAAVRAARGWRGDRRIELWQRDGLVLHWD